VLRIGRRRWFAMALSAWLSAWLTPAKAKPRSFSDVAKLRAYVIAALRKRPNVSSIVEDPADPAKFKMVAGGLPSTNTVQNLFYYLKANPEDDADQLIQRFLNTLTVDDKKPIGESNLVVVIRDRRYLDDMLKMGVNNLYEPVGADLVAMYMADQPDSMQQVRVEDFPGKDLAHLRKIALANVRHWLPKVEADSKTFGAGVFYSVDGNPMLSTSLILLDEFWASVAKRFPGDVLIALPRKDQLFIFNEGDAAFRAGIRRLIAATFEDNFNLLSPKLYARRSGKIVEVFD
jgi:uncharacterized protein YtpQ (UPF0354 family)